MTGLKIHLATPDCARSVGGFREPTENEREVLDLWKKLGLDKPDFSPGNVVGFLKRFRRLAAA